MLASIFSFEQVYQLYQVFDQDGKDKYIYVLCEVCKLGYFLEI